MHTVIVVIYDLQTNPSFNRDFPY